MIIGTSEAENEMTSRAMKEVFDLGQYSQQPANCFAAADQVDTATLQHTVIFLVLKKTLVHDLSKFYSKQCYYLYLSHA
jgi:hypothetical protein